VPPSDPPGGLRDSEGEDPPAVAPISAQPYAECRSILILFVYDSFPDFFIFLDKRSPCIIAKQLNRVKKTITNDETTMGQHICKLEKTVAPPNQPI